MTDVDTGWLKDALPRDAVSALRDGGEHHVWLLRSDRPADRSVLSAAEREQADRFRFGADRERYIVAHSLLRMLLSRYGGGEAAALEFVTRPLEKPALAGGGIEFNLSHAGVWVAFAFAGKPAVGIDIEEIRQLADARELARDVLHPAEQRALAARGGDAGEFFRIWTRKEALLKCSGIGLSVRLDDVDALAGSIGGALCALLTDLPAPPGYRAALAATSEGRLRVFGDPRETAVEAKERTDER